MNYLQIYENLCNRAKDRILDIHIETHHIIPRCMGGSNNLVDLTPEEHYTAHLLLVKIYPDNRKLIHAVGLMSVSGKNLHRSRNKQYGWIKRKLIEARTGVKHTEETKRKMSESHAGEKHWMYGRPKEDSAMFGKTHSVETKKLQSDAHLGEKNPMFGKSTWITGKKHTNETKIKMKSKRALQIFSEETKQKMSAAWLTKPILICPHCNKSSNHSGNMGRFHFNNCKKKTQITP